MCNHPVAPQMRPFELSKADFATHIRKSLNLRPVKLVSSSCWFAHNQHLTRSLKRLRKTRKEHRYVDNIRSVLEHVCHLRTGNSPPLFVEHSGVIVIPIRLGPPPMRHWKVVALFQDKGRNRDSYWKFHCLIGFLFEC